MSRISLFLLLLLRVTSLFAHSTDSLRFARANWTTGEPNPGVYWREASIDLLFGSIQHINLLTFKNKPRRMRIAFVSAGDSLRKTSWLAQEHQAFAAVNGTFFDTKRDGSVDMIHINGATLDTTRLDKSRTRVEHSQAAIVIRRNKLKIVYGGTAPRWDQHRPEPNVMVTGPLLLLDGHPHLLLKTRSTTTATRVPAPA